jgi:hypothetical protein
VASSRDRNGRIETPDQSPPRLSETILARPSMPFSMVNVVCYAESSILAKVGYG